MSLQWQLCREVPEDTRLIGQAILPETNLYRQIGDRFDQLFPQEAIYAPLYASQGRGAISPLLLGLVTLLQMLEKVPDRVAAEWVVSRIDWKYALHLPLSYLGFHFTDLYAFRQRLLKNQQERLLFDQLISKLKEAGLIHPRAKVRTDSTHLLAVVERLSQFELVAESLRLALKASQEQAPACGEQTLPVSFREPYHLRQSEYGLSESQIRERLRQTGQDAAWFLAQVDRSAPLPVRTLAEVEVLRKVLAQQFPQGPSHPPAEKRPAGKDILESPHEPEARFGTKRGRNWIGYKAQVSETCDEDRPHLIVDLEPSGALENDSPQVAPIQARLQGRGLTPCEQYVDQGYMSAQHLVESERGGIRLMGMPLEDTQGPAGFRQTDFQIDVAAQRVTCPAGQTSRVWSAKPDPRSPLPWIQIRMPAATCQACPFFGQCTPSVQGRSLTLSPYRAALLERRREAQSEAFREKMHLRAGIEATLSELVRGYRLRYARYRGLAKLRLQTYFTAMAANLKRLVRWWLQPHSSAPSTA